MTKVDKRVLRTRELLADALIEMTSEQGYESISIRDLTERAEIGYATFFRHYKSKDELLTEMLNTMVEGFMKLLPDISEESDPHERGIVLFQYVDQHTALCQVMLGSQGSSEMFRQLRNVATQTTNTLLKDALNDTLPSELVSSHLVSGVFSLIQWWLDHEKPYSPEKMAEYYDTLVLAPLRQFQKEGLTRF